MDNSCLQYFSGVSGTIKSFNYDGVNGRQLSNQDYSICIRTESNFCGIAYTTCPMGSFSITGPSGGSQTTPGTAIGALVNEPIFFLEIKIKIIELGWFHILQF